VAVEVDDSHPLIGVARRINRARSHLKGLKEPIERFRENDPHRLSKEFESEGKGKWLWVYYAEPERLPPVEWSLPMGEALYNLQSALDHLAWQLACLKDPEDPPSDLTFPIFKNKSKFWRKGKGGLGFTQQSGAHRLSFFPDDARDLVLAVQPYQCGQRAPEHPLWVLHELGNADKHKTLHVVSHVPADHKVEIVKLEGARYVDSDIERQPFDSRSKIGWVRLAALDPDRPVADINLKVKFAFEEAFAEGAPIGTSAWDALKRIHNYVADDVVLGRFLPYFDARR
jgi:hypothetical protein